MRSGEKSVKAIKKKKRHIWNFFIPAHIRHDLSLEEEHRRILFILIYSLGISVMLPLGISHLVQGNLTKAFIDFGACILGIVCILLVRPLKDGKILYRFAAFNLLVAFAYFGTLTPNGFRILWLYAFPIPAIFLLGAREGLIHTLILFGLWIIYFQLPPDMMGAASYSGDLKMRFILSFSLVVVWTYFFDFVRTRYREEMEERNLLLKKTNQELAMTQDIAGLVTWMFEVESQKITWSKEVFRMLGFEGRTDPPSFEEYLSLLHPDDIEVFQHNLQKALDGHSYEVELRHKRPDGDHNYTLTRAQPTVKDGNVTEVWGTIVNVTHLKQVEMALKEEVKQRLQYEKDLKSEIDEREKAERALRKSEDQIRLITDNIPAYMAYVDIETLTYRFVNRMFLTAYGKKSSEIIGHHIKEIIGQTNYEYALPYIEEASQGKVVSYINAFPLKDKTRWINVHYTPDFDENGKVKALFVLSHDISERMQAEKDLSHAKEAAEKANQTKSEFLANMSHELRTPLNAILGFSELMRRDTGLSVEQLGNLETIGRSGKHLLALINDVLEFSKIEAGSIRLKLADFDLHHFLQDLEEMFRLRAKQKRLSIEFKRMNGVPRYIRADQNKLRQVLVNLLGNAVKFTEQGRITLRVSCMKIDEQTQTSHHTLVFEVEDTGIGIPLKEQDNIFNAFYQADNPSSIQQGTGLGLPISQQFVHLMGGELTVRSKPDQGSLFTFSTQAELSARFNSGDHNHSRRVIGIAPGQPGFRLVVVEDNDDNRRLLTRLLRSCGFEVHEAVNGMDAIEKWQSVQPHLIWMDIRMPVMDGFEAIRQIKDQQSGDKTVIIALTASAFEEDREKVLEQGADDFIRKPFRESEIFEMMAKHLNLVFRFNDDNQLAKTPTEKLDTDAITESINALPKPIVNEFVEAVELIDHDRASTLVRRIEEVDKPLADLLKEKIDAYQYDSLQHFFSKFIS